MKKLIGLFMSLVFMALIFTGFAYADPYSQRSHEWRDKQTFAKNAELSKGSYLTGFALKVATKAMVDLTDWTLNAAESICNFLSVTASGSEGAIIAPDIAGRYYILRNAADESVTIKISGGTGVAVATGKTATVIHNGTDYVRITADATH